MYLGDAHLLKALDAGWPGPPGLDLAVPQLAAPPLAPREHHQVVRQRHDVRVRHAHLGKKQEQKLSHEEVVKRR